jgi:hypothetical protein
MTYPISDETARALNRTRKSADQLARRVEQLEATNRTLQAVIPSNLNRLAYAYPNLGAFLIELAALDQAAHPLTIPIPDPDPVRQRPVGSSATPGAKTAHWRRRRTAWNRKLADYAQTLTNELDGKPRYPDDRTRCNRRTPEHPRGLTLPYGSTICSICHQPLTNQED